MEARFLMGSQIFGSIEDHRGQPRPSAGDIGRKPNVCLKHFSVDSASLTPHGGTKNLASAVETRNIHQSREVGTNRLTWKSTRFQAKKAVGRFVGEQHGAVGTGGDNRGRA